MIAVGGECAFCGHKMVVKTDAVDPREGAKQYAMMYHYHMVSECEVCEKLWVGVQKVWEGALGVPMFNL